MLSKNPFLFGLLLTLFSTHLFSNEGGKVDSENTKPSALKKSGEKKLKKSVSWDENHQINDEPATKVKEFKGKHVAKDEEARKARIGIKYKNRCSQFEGEEVFCAKCLRTLDSLFIHDLEDWNEKSAALRKTHDVDPDKFFETAGMAFDRLEDCKLYLE